MPSKINIKKIITDNDAINEEEFYRFRKILEKRKQMGVKGAKYDILSPYTTRRRIKRLDKTYK